MNPRRLNNKGKLYIFFVFTMVSGFLFPELQAQDDCYIYLKASCAESTISSLSNERRMKILTVDVDFDDFQKVDLRCFENAQDFAIRLQVNDEERAPEIVLPSNVKSLRIEGAYFYNGLINFLDQISEVEFLVLIGTVKPTLHNSLVRRISEMKVKDFDVPSLSGFNEYSFLDSLDFSHLASLRVGVKRKDCKAIRRLLEKLISLESLCIRLPQWKEEYVLEELMPVLKKTTTHLALVSNSRSCWDIDLSRFDGVTNLVLRSVCLDLERTPFNPPTQLEALYCIDCGAWPMEIELLSSVKMTIHDSRFHFPVERGETDNPQHKVEYIRENVYESDFDQMWKKVFHNRNYSCVED